MDETRLELKICERCGALYLCGVVSGGVYCRRCTTAPQSARPAGKVKVNRAE